MVLVLEYLESLKSDSPYTIDTSYYLEKSLMNSLNQLISVGFKDVIAKLPHVSYKPTNRHKAICLDKPVKILFMLNKFGYTLDKFLKVVLLALDELDGKIITLQAKPKAITNRIEIIEESNPNNDSNLNLNLNPNPNANPNNNSNILNDSNPNNYPKQLVFQIPSYFSKQQPKTRITLVDQN
jgi:hypothetical protein